MKKNSSRILPLDKYINECLYDTNFGFYFKKNPFGKNGDFITSPNISVLFSEIISIWIVMYWKSINCPKKLNIVELGAGNGEMIYQINKTTKKFSDCHKSLKFYIIDYFSREKSKTICTIFSLNISQIVQAIIYYSYY